ARTLLGPNCEDKATAWPEHSPGLADPRVRLWQVHEAKTHGDDVKRLVGKLKSLGVSLAKVNLGITLSRLTNHRFAEIDTCHRGSPLACRRGHQSRPPPHIP